MVSGTMEAAQGRRRSTRMAAGALARFRYRENSSDSDDTKDSASAKLKREKYDSDGDAHIPHDSGDDSSLSELSFNSDDEAAPKRKSRARVASTRTTKSKTTITTISTYTAPAAKRKRAATTTTTTTTTETPATVTVLPTHKKRTTDSVKSEAGTERDDRLLVKREVKDEEEDDASRVLAATAKRASSRKARKPARVITTKVKREGGAGDATTTHVEPPTDWALFYDLVMEMRQPGGPAANAAVDTMGCERLAQASASARDRRFHTLIALMLSSQTKDTVNAVAMQRLYTELPPHKPGAPAGLNLENILAVDPVLLNQLIWQVGFHNNKTKYIKQAAVICRDQWDGDIPSTAEGLMALPGVGPKMAYLCLSAEHGWNRVEGIGVDVHVHRITNLWGWQKAGSPQAKTPESTRLALQSWLPKEKWKELNWLLVGFGQAVCLPQGAKCGDCTLGLRGLCRAANRKKVNEGRQRRIEMGQDIEDFDIKDVKDEVKDDVK